jgi:hypothetical protein
VIAEPPDDAENFPPVELDDRFTVVDPEVTALSNWSWRWTVIGPNVALDDATPDTGVVVNISCDAAAASTVSPCVAEVNPDAAAVIVGDPATVSLYLKLALDDPSGIVTDAMLAVSAVSRNTPPDELDDRLTVVEPDVTAFPNVSRRCTVIVPDVTPAVSVCADVVNTKLLAAAAVIVSCCVADDSPDAAAVIVGVPAFVSP